MDGTPSLCHTLAEGKEGCDKLTILDIVGNASFWADLE